MEIGHNVMHGQWDWMRDPKIHSTTWEWDNASPSEQWKHSHNELHHTYTNVIGKDNDLGYGIMRVDEDQRWVPFYLAQPLWNFINACFFEYGIAAYDLELGKNLRHQEAPQQPGVQGPRQGDAEEDPRPDDQGLRRAPAAVRPVGADHAGRERHRQPGPQPVDPLGHHVRPLPRGRRDLRAPLDQRRDPRRVVPAPDARLGQHQRQQGDALHDRQPVASRSSTTCSPTCRATATPRSPRRCRRCSTKYDLTYVTGSLPRQVGSAWKKVIRLSLPNDFASKAQAKVLSIAKPASPSRRAEDSAAALTPRL